MFATIIKTLLMATLYFTEVVMSQNYTYRNFKIVLFGPTFDSVSDTSIIETLVQEGMGNLLSCSISELKASYVDRTLARTEVNLTVSSLSIINGYSLTTLATDLKTQLRTLDDTHSNIFNDLDSCAMVEWPPETFTTTEVLFSTTDVFIDITDPGDDESGKEGFLSGDVLMYGMFGAIAVVVIVVCFCLFCIWRLQKNKQSKFGEASHQLSNPIEPRQTELANHTSPKAKSNPLQQQRGEAHRNTLSEANPPAETRPKAISQIEGGGVPQRNRLDSNVSDMYSDINIADDPMEQIKRLATEGSTFTGVDANVSNLPPHHHSTVGAGITMMGSGESGAPPTDVTIDKQDSVLEVVDMIMDMGANVSLPDWGVGPTAAADGMQRVASESDNLARVPTVGSEIIQRHDSDNEVVVKMMMAADGAAEYGTTTGGGLQDEVNTKVLDMLDPKL